MTPLVSLWLPILLSAVGVFLGSSVLHMFTGWHKSDYLKVPNEDRVMDMLRPLAIPPGDYMMPRPESTEQMRSPAFVEKFKKGPVMMFTVMPGGSMAMGKNLIQWFLFSVVVGIFAAFVEGRPLHPWERTHPVVRCAATGANVWTTGPILRVPHLVRWADALDQLRRGRPEGVATLTSDEPNLTAVIRSTDRAGQLQLVVDITPDPPTQEHRLRFPVERSALRDVVRQCRAIVKAYPVRDPDGAHDA